MRIQIRVYFTLLIHNIQHQQLVEWESPDNLSEHSMQMQQRKTLRKELKHATIIAPMSLVQLSNRHIINALMMMTLVAWHSGKNIGPGR